VPARFGEPKPMVVLQQIKLGLSVTAFASSIALLIELT
jgi:hypothetical protein